MKNVYLTPWIEAYIICAERGYASSPIDGDEDSLIFSPDDNFGEIGED